MAETDLDYKGCLKDPATKGREMPQIKVKTEGGNQDDGSKHLGLWLLWWASGRDRIHPLPQQPPPLPSMTSGNK